MSSASGPYKVATPVTARPAASVIFLRDSPLGPEVLLLERHALSDTQGGSFVFPGGKVDADDAKLDASRHLDTTAQALHARLNDADLDPSGAAALFVSAVREAYEECALLMAEGRDSPGPISDEVHNSHAAGTSFNELVTAFDLRLNVSSLEPWSRWITPIHAPKRFDTRFFVARAPEGEARHDERETTQEVWVHPRSALESYWRGEMQLVGPQIMTLAHLSRHASVDSVLAEARTRGPLLVQPLYVKVGESTFVCYPGDEAHSVSTRAMPGPLRMQIRDNRYLPQAGFDAFFE